jgi:hypothetical protein
MAGSNDDRYEPLPGLLQLPGHFVRKLGPTGRRVAAGLAALALTGLAVFLIVGLPAINDRRAEREAAERRAAAQERARLIERLRAEVRLRRGRGTPAVTVPERHALVGALAAAVTTDARERARTGELGQEVRRAECERYPRSPTGADPADDPSLRRARYSCLAVTRDIAPTAASGPGLIGYPYRALVRFESGRFTYCKISGRPGEFSIQRELLQLVPRACGGGR